MVVSVTQHAFTAKQVLTHEQSVAEQLSIDMYALMEAAGLAVFNEIIALNITTKQQQPSFLVLVGKGNNGGDGLVIARLAAIAGFKVKVLLLTNAKTLTGHALTAYQALLAIECDKLHLVESEEQTHFELSVIDADIIVDAIFGIGFRGNLPSHIELILNKVNQLSALKVAVDLPSGVNATTGAVATIAFQADKTVSFIAQKQGLYTGQAVNYCGEVILKKLMMTETFCQLIPTTTYLQTLDTLPYIAPRKVSAHKGVIGLLLAIGGNQGFPGAIKLASQAALRAGASLVSVLSHKNCQQIIHSTQAELMIAGNTVEDLQQSKLIESAKMLIIGPGLGTDHWAQTLFNYTLEKANVCDKWLVVDADGLNLLASQSNEKTHYFRFELFQ